MRSVPAPGCDKMSSKGEGDQLMRYERSRAFVIGAIVLGLGSTTPAAFGATTFLHHFDVGDPLNNGAYRADYAAGDPNQLFVPAAGQSAGQIVSGGKFGNALSKPDPFARVLYSTAGNVNVNKGTIEMWIKGPGVTGTGSPSQSGFRSLWGLDTSSGNTDIRMYIYNDNANDGLRSLGAYQLNGGGSFWEIERPIPVEKLDDTNWHHAVWQFDATPGSASTALWWDGVLLGNAPDDGFAVSPRTSSDNTRFLVGESQTGSAPWPGLIDEFRISDDLVYDPNGDFIPPTAPFATPTPVVAGDYDNDSDVDGNDFLVWQRGFGSNVAPPGTDPDGSANGVVDAADLTVWRNNFGAGAATAARAIPEPSNWLTAAVCIAALTTGRLKRYGIR